MTYEQLLDTAEKNGLAVKEQPLIEYDGLIRNNRIAIRKNIETDTEKSCVLAEELGHYYTSSGNIIDLQDVRNQKQEYRARLYGYNLKIGLSGIIQAYESGCRNLYEMAEHLDVTEEYLIEALKCYKEKYGLYTIVDNYIIYFSPNLSVAKLF